MTDDVISKDTDVLESDRSVSSFDEPDAAVRFPVVGIGASAGGLEAFRQLLAGLPPDTGMAFILVQHLDPRHESKLTDLLARSTSMPVVEVTDGLTVSANGVYVIPPNANLAMEGGKLRVTPRSEGRGPHLPIDFLFRSLAQDQKGRAIGVVLSGTGSDGTLGLCEIKAVGGITFAQREESARHGGMPHSAIDSGCVDFVLPPEEIARQLAQVGGHPYLAAVPVPVSEEEPPDHEDHLKRILLAVRSATGVDFSLYRDTTIKRRIMRRMALHAHQSLRDYAKRLQADRGEVDALYHDLLINVTSFFRDNEMFDALKERVFPDLMKSKPPGASFRVWVPGCSTGQEAYSIAIALLEFLDDKPARPPIQVFATDLSDLTALDKARAGIYPESIEGEVSPERLRRFFRKEDHVYRIDKSIREMVVFARQNVTADPPFSHMDLISCRNVLIYLSSALQRRILPTFHYALNVPGFLVLGGAETIGDNGDLFELVDRSQKIYAKKATAIRLPLSYATAGVKGIDALGVRRFVPPGPMPADFQREADRVLLGRYSPAGVLVNENFDIIQFRGATSAYLESPPGEPTTNVLKMAREGLFLELRNALSEARKTNLVVRRDDVQVRGDGRYRDVGLEIIPIKPPGIVENCFLILFHDGTSRTALVDPVAEAPAPAGADRTVIQLTQELAATKEYLQSMVEQQDAANEELRSANEEILSSNEELQSTNEELETAKEELQSANEELTTVNEQLHHRNLELTRANNDLTNLMSSTNIPVIMVGADLRIRRFTSPARNVMSLLPTDIGRPIGDIKLAVMVPDLEAIIESVIETVQSQERVARDRDGRWHSLRVYPYRTSDRKIDGAVLLLVDIDEQKRAEEALRFADRRKDEFLATLAHELRNPVSPIANAVEIMRLAPDDAATVAHAREVLERQVKQLSRIVEDLIDVSRIVEKKVELKPEQVNLSAVVQTALESCLSQIEGRHQRLDVSLPREEVAFVADPVRLGQILINLLNNAAKFTEVGGLIWLSAEVRGDRISGRMDGASEATATRTPHVVIKVRDNGIGISGELLPHVFEMFTQGDRSESQRGGLGIGLSLVRALVQMHGGEIEAFSEGAGKGSEFIVRLPLHSGLTESLDDGSRPMSRVAGTRRRIMVVDDNEDQAHSLAMLLRVLGHETRMAFDGPSAVELAASFVPDIALVDIGIPGINGYEVARRLREFEHLRSTILVAQTGWNQNDDRRRSREAGFDYHMVKPLDMPALQRILADGDPPGNGDSA